ncbi:uncharacterized protein LOC134847927 isoform X2 [Symsagittifera roscoffensis]|uniref:uncharacterized protein LOC134847927 isoform X2 n=1 Tax=Symsagittifera roscoffensis TaxID=84072 RepID=UPI00307C2DF0
MQVSEQEVPKLLHLLEQASLDDERYDCVLDIKKTSGNNDGSDDFGSLVDIISDQDEEELEMIHFNSNLKLYSQDFESGNDEMDCLVQASANELLSTPKGVVEEKSTDENANENNVDNNDVLAHLRNDEICSILAAALSSAAVATNVAKSVVKSGGLNNLPPLVQTTSNRDIDNTTNIPCAIAIPNVIPPHQNCTLEACNLRLPTVPITSGLAVLAGGGERGLEGEKSGTLKTVMSSAAAFRSPPCKRIKLHHRPCLDFEKMQKQKQTQEKTASLHSYFSVVSSRRHDTATFGDHLSAADERRRNPSWDSVSHRELSTSSGPVQPAFHEQSPSIISEILTTSDWCENMDENANPNIITSHVICSNTIIPAVAISNDLDRNRNNSPSMKISQLISEVGKISSDAEDACCVEELNYDSNGNLIKTEHEPSIQCSVYDGCREEASWNQKMANVASNIADQENKSAIAMTTSSNSVRNGGLQFKQSYSSKAVTNASSNSTRHSNRNKLDNHSTSYKLGSYNRSKLGVHKLKTRVEDLWTPQTFTFTPINFANPPSQGCWRTPVAHRTHVGALNLPLGSTNGGLFGGAFRSLCTTGT